MLICGCGRWMHTEGIEEHRDEERALWFIRSECGSCGLKVGLDMPAGQTNGIVDRLMWTDEALHRLERMPPYLAPLFRDEIEQEARARGDHVISYELLLQPRTGQSIQWQPEAERRLYNIPVAVRAMARIELERTAAERGEHCVTVPLMEEVRGRYFGMGAQKP